MHIRPAYTKSFSRAHVTTDLDAYVCLFDECDNPEQLYHHSSDWLEHMRGHTLRWRCNSKSHGTQTFLTGAQYLDHMKDAHASSFTEPQLHALAKRNARPIGPMFTHCPICGTDEATNDLEAHIVGHLRFLALRSLPPYEDEGSESSDQEKGSSNASRPQSRSTIKNDPERYTIPIFAEFDSNEAWEFGTKNRLGLYAPWGGYRNYITATANSNVVGSVQEHAPAGSFSLPDITDIEHELSVTGDGITGFSDDASSCFVEGSLFDGIPMQARQHFEWGFVTGAAEAQLGNLENDRVIRSILDYKRGVKGIPPDTTRIFKEEISALPEDNRVVGGIGDPDAKNDDARGGEEEYKGVRGGEEDKDEDMETHLFVNFDDERGDEKKNKARSYDPVDDAARLARALKEEPWAPEIEPLIEILPALTHEQVMELGAVYKHLVKTGAERKEVSVTEHIRARLEHKDMNLMTACYATALGRWGSEAYWATIWYQGDKMGRELLIELLIGRTNDEIRAIKNSFSDENYVYSLTRCLRAELEEDIFKKAILMVLEERRMEEVDPYGRLLPLNATLIETDVDDLRKAIKSEKGGETVIMEFVILRSDPHLREVLKLYERTHKSKLARDALKKCGDGIVSVPLIFTTPYIAI